MSDDKRPTIAEKVRFWEEQEKINQALIPRVLEMHEAVVDLNQRTANISEQIAAAEARVLQRVHAQLQGVNGSTRSSRWEHTRPHQSAPRDVRFVAYAALALATLACVLSLYQLLS
jgi:hypothetical protein